MQTTRKAVRYYIDRDADTPVIRTVPVTRTNSEVPSATPPAADATPCDASTTRMRGARRRLASIVHGPVRRHRRQIS